MKLFNENDRDDIRLDNPDDANRNTDSKSHKQSSSSSGNREQNLGKDTSNPNFSPNERIAGFEYIHSRVIVMDNDEGDHQKGASTDHQQTNQSSSFRSQSGANTEENKHSKRGANHEANQHTSSGSTGQHHTADSREQHGRGQQHTEGTRSTASTEGENSNESVHKRHWANQYTSSEDTEQHRTTDNREHHGKGHASSSQRTTQEDNSPHKRHWANQYTSSEEQTRAASTTGSTNHSYSSKSHPATSPDDRRHQNPGRPKKHE